MDHPVKLNINPFLIITSTIAVLLSSFAALAAETKRQIEEVVVTAEKVESTVSDTSISITAFSEDTIENFGIQSPDELVNYIPATTRDAYDIRIRGVGRNFRALGGDPGVATYYNGIFSPDFGIAATENGLYDLKRVEVLRGPQGTLYGRNSIGGALNYVTNDPTYEPEGEVRVQWGAYSTKEYYGILSGGIIDNVLAARVVGTKRQRAAWQKGIGDSADTDGVNDHNLAFTFLLEATDSLTAKVRVNDRKSDRTIGMYGLVDEGPMGLRGPATSYPAYGLRVVPNGTPGALTYTDPGSGALISGLPVRPGIDEAASPQPNAGYQRSGLPFDQLYGSKGEDTGYNLVNTSAGRCEFPYPNTECNHELFDHQASSLELTWDINEDMSLTYLFGTNDFEYTFNIDIDGYDSEFSKYRQTVLEDVWSYSHELRLQAEFADRVSLTAGLFQFKESRQQNYSLTNNTLRFTQAADYGDLAIATPTPPNLSLIGLPDVDFGLGGASFMQLLGFLTGIQQSPVTIDSAGDGEQVAGLWGGSEDLYRHKNRVGNEQVAAYAQATIDLSDQFSIVLGARYAKDDKAALERRFAYYELPATASGSGALLAGLSTLPPAIMPLLGYAETPKMVANAAPFGALPAEINPFGQNLLYALYAGGFVTPLSLVNMAMGRATFTGDPANPIAPNCEITNANCASPLLLQGIPVSLAWRTSDSDSWSDTNFRVNLDWTPNDDTLMYFSVTTGYRAGGYSLGILDARGQNSGTGCVNLGFYINCLSPLSYDKETVMAYEIGYKGTLADGRAQVNASIYRYDYEGYQDQIDTYDMAQARSVDTVTNAGDATNQGFEIELTWLLGDYLTLGGNYSYTDTEYSEDYLVTERDDPSLPNSLFQYALNEDGSRVTTATGFAFNLDAYLRQVQGNPLKRIPKHKGVIYGTYEFPTTNGTLSLNATVSYTGEYWSSAIQRELDRVPSRRRVDLSANWRDSEGKWVVRGFVDNVTDERVYRGFGTATESSNYRLTGERLYPRYWGVDITRRFGG
jgi:outer membrane receptor protein involved in Fe transport